MPTKATTSPSGTSRSASPRVSTVVIPSSMPSGTDQYHAGAAIQLTASPSTTAAIVNEAIPSGSCSRRKTRSFQVAGSRRRVPIRRDQPASRGSGLYGCWISTPVSALIRRRSSSANQRQAYIVPIRIGIPTSVMAVPSPTEIAVTRNVNQTMPSGRAISR